MRRSLIIFACLIWLFAGCGSQTPDSMTAAIYSASTIYLSPPGHPNFTNPIVEWHVRNTPLIQHIYQAMLNLPLAHGGGVKVCSGYTEVLTFYTGSSVITRAYSYPCYTVGIHIDTQQENRAPTQAFLQLIQQATGFGMEPYTGDSVPITGS